MKALFDGISAGLSLPASESGFAVQDSWQGMVGTLLAGGLGIVAIYICLSALLPMLVVCLLTIAAILLALIIRQALIVLLTVLSPIAFVAFLLPNTQALFNRWRRLFITLLVLYPIVSMLFGAGSLANKIIGSS